MIWAITRRPTSATTASASTAASGRNTHGSIPQAGGDYVAVNVRALDVDLALFEGKPIRYVDGRANTWEVLKTEPYHSPVPKTRGKPLPYGQMPQT